MIRFGVGSNELAFLSTLALLSTDRLVLCDAGHASVLRDIETNVIRAFQVLDATESLPFVPF